MKIKQVLSQNKLSHLFLLSDIYSQSCRYFIYIYMNNLVAFVNWKLYYFWKIQLTILTEFKVCSKGFTGII